MERFDLCILGAGPSGFAAAMRAWDFGARVCLVSKGDVGGAGIYNGVLMSKTLWELSKDYRRVLLRDRGYQTRGVDLHFSQVQQVCVQAMQEKADQMLVQLKACREPSGSHPGSISIFDGHARFVDNNTIAIHAADKTSSEIYADNVIIATGSRPRMLDFIPVDGKTVFTSDHGGQLQELPKSMVIVGAGVIGCEFATIFANFGRTKVNLIDRAPRILPLEDEDIARVVAKNLEEKGVTVHHEASLRSLEIIDGEVEYTIEHLTGAKETIRVEKALLSVGRIPNTDSLGLENTDVEVNEQGYIIDENTQTSVPHIYGVGDVTHHLALVNVGEIEARHAVERIFGGRTEPISYENMSTIMFLDPEVAAVGINESQAQAQRIPYKVATYHYSLVNRAIAMRATDGFVKVIASDDEEMKILGMRALGVHASTTIEAVALAIHTGISVKEFGELIHPHPAITEGVQECIRMLLGTSIYKPEFFPGKLRLSHVTFDDN